MTVSKFHYLLRRNLPKQKLAKDVKDPNNPTIGYFFHKGDQKVYKIRKMNIMELDEFGDATSENISDGRGKRFIVVTQIC
jgi:hypothetical protein